jgi:hypothetical protein
MHGRIVLSAKTRVPYSQAQQANHVAGADGVEKEAIAGAGSDVASGVVAACSPPAVHNPVHLFVSIGLGPPT